MIYHRDAKKGEAAYLPKSHSAPLFVGHNVEGLEEWVSWYCFNKKPGAVNVKSKVLSITKDNEGWYHYTFTDGGWHGENKIKLHMENGKVVMDELKCVYDEAAIQ